MTMFTCAITPHHQPFTANAWCGGAVFFIFSLLAGTASCTLAQALTTAPMTAASSAKSATLPKNLNTLITASNPAWQDLTPAQQLSLKPLAEQWNSLEEAHKRKWIAVAANYPTLAPPEQLRLHSRMTEWVSLSKQQRAQARLNFSQSKQLTPTQKTATWEAYQALSPEEKKQLATLPPHKPAGAATAIKQTPPEKLSVVPVNRKSSVEIPQTAPTKQSHVNRNTLLPHALPPIAPASTPKN
jgi:hypothetical protein